MKTNKIKTIKIVDRTAINGAPEFYSMMFSIINTLKENRQITDKKYKTLFNDVIYKDGPKPGSALKKIAQEHGIDIPEGLL